MRPSQHARLTLRDATSAWHDRVDAAFSAADLTERTGYSRFLLAQAGAHLPVEAALDAAGIEAVIPDWGARRRASLLLSDLAALDLPPPPIEPTPAFDDVPAMLGGAYVLEGSRLGGTMLRRSVPDAFPTAFLSGGGSAAWRALISLLDERLRSEEDIDAAITAACEVFALFERSGRRHIEGGPQLAR